MADAVLLTESSGGVLTLTLNRPERLNALDWRLLDALADAFGAANRDDAVRVVVLTGAGRGFCSGADLAGDPSGPAPVGDRRLRTEPMARFGRLAVALQNVRKPVIAAVNGVAAGAGLALALGCDLRIAADTARFSAIFVRRGLVPDTGVSWYLPRLVGMARALELVYTGDIISAAEADRIGLVNRVAPAAALLDEAQALAARIAAGPPLALELAKRVMWKGLAVDDLETQVSYETWAQDIAMASEDANEGSRAFLEKREPKFTGR